MCPAQAFTSDKMVLVLLCGVPLHWLYMSTANENHRFCLIETTLGNIGRNYTQYNLQSFSVVPSYSLIKWTQDLRNLQSVAKVQDTNAISQDTEEIRVSTVVRVTMHTYP